MIKWCIYYTNFVYLIQNNYRFEQIIRKLPVKQFINQKAVVAVCSVLST